MEPDRATSYKLYKWYQIVQPLLLHNIVNYHVDRQNSKNELSVALTITKPTKNLINQTSKTWYFKSYE